MNQILIYQIQNYCNSKVKQNQKYFISQCYKRSCRVIEVVSDMFYDIDNCDIASYADDNTPYTSDFNVEDIIHFTTSCMKRLKSTDVWLWFKWLTKCDSSNRKKGMVASFSISARFTANIQLVFVLTQENAFS